MRNRGWNGFRFLIGCSFFTICTISACSKKINSINKAKQVTVTVGTKRIATDKFSNKGTPVVHMWEAGQPVTDHQSAGFPVLTSAEHAVVWQPKTKSDGGYNHYACLIFFKGRFFAMWGNHPMGEDAPGQRILYSVSTTWGTWSEAKELLPAPGPVQARTEKGIHLKPDRWAIVDDRLYAIIFVHGAGVYPIAMNVMDDGTFGAPVLLDKLENGASLPVFMKANAKTAMDLGRKINQWYEDSDAISWWAAEKQGVTRTGIDGSKLIESFSYRTTDNTLVAMLRNWGTPSNPVHNNRMYVSFSKNGRTFDTPYPTDIPDSPTRGQAIRLNDGTILLIGSQTTPVFDKALYLDRDPITIAVSKDGYIFSKAFALRVGAPKSYRIAGVGGRNPGFAYSSSLVKDDYLYTLYSIGKEDVGISRVKVAELTE